MYKVLTKEEMKEVEKIKREKERRILRLWGGRNYKEYMNLIEKRREILNELYLVYPEMLIQAESINGKRTELFGVDPFDPRFFAPAIHYRVLPNEIVFDIDISDKCILEKIVRELIRFGVNPIYGESGNKGYHIHVLVTVKGYSPVEVAEIVSRNPEYREIMIVLFEKIQKLSGIENDAVDDCVMNHTHTIRSFYSLNVKGLKWKIPNSNNKSYPVLVLTKSLCKIIKSEIEVMDMERKIEKEIMSETYQYFKDKYSKVKWIEDVLNNPEKINDGRRRLILAVLPQYLIFRRKLSGEQAMEILLNWVSRTPRGDDNYLRHLIKSQIRQCFLKPDVMQGVLRKYANYERFTEQFGIDILENL